MKCAAGTSAHLGSEESLQLNMETLVEYNMKTTLQIEVLVKLENCTISSLQEEQVSQVTQSSTPVDINQLLISNQKKLHDQIHKYDRNRLPRPKKETNGKCKLWNALLDYCIENDIRYVNHLQIDEREKSFDSIVEILWKINVVDIGRSGWKKKPPKDLDKFLGFSFHDTNAERGKKKRAPLDQSTLNDLHVKLTGILDSVCFTKGSGQMFEFLNGLLESIGAQTEDCIERAQRKSTKRVKELWNASWEVWNANSLGNQVIKTCPVRPHFLPPPPKYKKLNHALGQAQMYKPLPLIDYTPDYTSRYSYWEFRRNIKIQYNALMVHVKHGGSIRDEVWIFKVDSKDKDHDQKVNDAIDTCRTSSACYVQKWIQKAFDRQATTLFPDVPLMRAFCSEFLGNEYAAKNEASQQQKDLLELAIQSGDRSLLEDARKMNGRREEVAFAEFWRITSEFLNEAADAAHARRHGEAEMGYLSSVISIRDLHELVKNRMKKELEESYDEALVPSTSTLYLQFMPSASNRLTSFRFKSRFNVQMKVQRRLLHIDHIDAHYGNAIIKYLRSFAVRYRDHCCFLCADDKARVMVGPPGVYLQSGVRNKPQLTPYGIEMLALDHDYDGTCIVPSVYLAHDIPEKVNGDWYKGQVSVGLKDAVFQKSCPWRHVEELSRHLKHNHSPILMLLTDGGPDRNLKRATVIASHISLFLKHDLDMLVVARTVPHLSFRNPVERVMSVLNLALQNVSLCRENLPDLEEQLKGCNSMGAIRQKAKQYQGGIQAFQDMLHKSLKKTIDLIGGRMQRLQWKGKDIEVYQAGDWDDISAFISLFLELDEFPEAFQEQCSSGNSIDFTEFLKKGSAMKEFLTNHVHQSPYVLQIRKRAGCDCRFCKNCIIKPPRMDFESFQDLNWVPLPLKKQTGPNDELHYKPFDELYGTHPNHMEQPSLRDSKPDRKGKHSIYTANRARSFLHCSNCSKRRVIYLENAQQSLSKDEKAYIKTLNELGMYVCGSEVVHASNPNESNIASNNIMDITCEDDSEGGNRGEDRQDYSFYLRDGLTCSTPMESSYFFGNRLHKKRNLNICSHCGLEENHVQQATSEELQSYSNVFHPCSVCLSIADGQKRPKPLYGSKVSKRRGSSSVSTNTTMRSSARESKRDTLMDEAEEASETEPSGHYSLCSDSD